MLKDIMSRNIIFGKIDDDIYKLANIMRENDIGFLPILDGKLVCGVITDRDIVIRAISNNDFCIKNYLSRVVSIDINYNVVDVFSLMEKYKIKRVIVSSDNKMVGIISISDLFDFDCFNTIKTIFSIDKNVSFQEAEIDEFYL